MIKFYLLFFAITLTTIANAQITKGDIFLGGNVSFSSYSAKNTTTQTNTSIAPQIGRIFNDHTAFGVGLNYSSNSVNYTSYQLKFDVFHRWYVPIAPSFYFVLHSEIAAGFGHNGSVDGSGKNAVYEISTGPRFAWFATPNWSFEGRVGSIGLSRDQYKATNFTFSAGGFGLGVYYYFKKK